MKSDIYKRKVDAPDEFWMLLNV